MLNRRSVLQLMGSVSAAAAVGVTPVFAADKMRIAMVVKALGIGFFDACRDGGLEAAKELGITIIAYSPLAQGVLSGRFHDDPSLVKGIGVRRFRPSFSQKNLERSRPLVMELKVIAAAHGATPAQVSLAWLTTFHGDTVVAIPGATSVTQAQSNVGAMKVSLGAAELAQLDTLSRAAG